MGTTALTGTLVGRDDGVWLSKSLGWVEDVFRATKFENNIAAQTAEKLNQVEERHVFTEELWNAARRIAESQAGESRVLPLSPERIELTKKGAV